MPSFGNSIPLQGISTAASAVTVTSVNPGADTRMRVRYVVASYVGTTPVGVLTISDGANVAWAIDVGATALVLPALELLCGAGKTVTIALTSGGAGVIGKFNAYLTLE